MTSSSTQRMDKIVLYVAIGLVILFMVVLLILALARPLQAAQPRLDAQLIPLSRRLLAVFDFAVLIRLRPATQSEVSQCQPSLDFGPIGLV